MEEKIPFEAGPPCMGADVVEGTCRERPEAAKKFAEAVLELIGSKNDKGD